MNISEVLIDEVLRIKEKNLSDDDLRKSQQCLADYLAVSFAGSKMLEKEITSYASGFSEGDIRLLGSDLKTGLLTSAFLHGMMSHVAELDDGHRYGMFHPGAPIFSALLPLAQTTNVNKELFFKSVISGYQISIKIAQLMQPDLKKRGFHATGIAGTIGAGIASGILLNFNRQQLLNTLSACCTSASGILKVIKDGSDMKPLNVAFAAQNGITASLSAKVGFMGADDVIGGRLGFVHAFIGDTNYSEEIILNSSLVIHDIYLKPYAACRHCHGPIEGVILLQKEKNIDNDSISSIDIETYSLAIDGHDHHEIRSVNSAKMSIPYSVAVAAMHGRGNIDLFEEPFISNGNILALTKKVSVKEDAAFTALVPGKRAARVIINLINGEKCVKEVLLPKGEPENPLSGDDLVEKFQSLLKYSGRSSNQASALFKNIFNSVSNSKGIRNLMEQIYNT